MVDGMEEQEQAKKEPKKSVYCVQVGERYRVKKCTNFLELNAGALLTKEEAQKLIDKGVNFSYGQNS